MSITALAFLAIYFSSLAMAVFRHPRYGLYAYLFAFYMHPPDRWWSSDVPDLRWALIAGIVTLVMLVRHDSEQQRQSWLQTGAGKLLLWYLAWMVLQTLWSVTGDLHIEGLELFAKYVVLFYLIYRLVDSEIEFRNFFIVHMLGCFYLGWLAFRKNRLGPPGGHGRTGHWRCQYLRHACINGSILCRRPAVTRRPLYTTAGDRHDPVHPERHDPDPESRCLPWPGCWRPGHIVA